LRQTIKEGLGIAEQLAAFPFTAARQALTSSETDRGPWGDVVRDSLSIGEGLARLPFKVTVALLGGANTEPPPPQPPSPPADTPG
jgi:hypothetical protein